MTDPTDDPRPAAEGPSAQIPAADGDTALGSAPVPDPARDPDRAPVPDLSRHAHEGDPGRSDWRSLLAVFFVVSLVEAFGVSQIFAFLPQYLTQMGVPSDERLAFIGIFTSLMFLVGLPLVPLWGVWADKYSRKGVIIRSALVEATVLTAVALSTEPWQLALSLLLVGLQLGNTGVMLSAIRDVTPRRRVGTAVGLFGASSPIGFALGPIVGGILVDGVGLSLSAVFLASAGLSLATALLLALTREVRPAVVPTGRVLTLAFGAVRGVVADPTVRRIFVIYTLAFLANQMTRPYTPVLVEDLVGAGAGLAAAVGVVAGLGALVGAMAAPAGGVLGDRVGFRPVLLVALLGGAVALLLAPIAPTVALLAGTVVVFVACNGAVGPMIFALLATEVPSERRSATLNLVYLPLYIAGIVGPAIGAGVSTTLGVGAPFAVGAVALVLGALGLLGTMRTLRTARAAS
jgi:DHA1 family multidrug resistance protein-like MFS transporter